MVYNFTMQVNRARDFMQQLIKTLRSFSNELRGASNFSLSSCMSYYDGKSVEFNRDFYTTKINSDEQISKIVEDILIHLKIPPLQWGRYLGAPLTVNDFLVELFEHNSKENQKLKEFIALIDEQKYKKWLCTRQKFN